ncbi:hypothetical protein OIV83_004492 [Microbotryomycetes sp. JL201]|nr:hypothetical protein OIV83_004492 [Microbotryomycetes sp. JL201]
MATSTTSGTPASPTPAHVGSSSLGAAMGNPRIAQDRSTVLLHCYYKGVQLSSIAAPPLLLINQLRKRTFSPSRLLKSLTISSFVVTPLIVTGLGYGRMSGVGDEGVQDRAVRLRSNQGQRSVDDKSIIGGVLGALATTTVFLRRASILWTVGGGASLGIAGGVLYHVMNQVQKGEDVSPEMMVQEAKEAMDKGGK